MEPGIYSWTKIIVGLKKKLEINNGVKKGKIITGVKNFKTFIDGPKR